MNNHQIAGGWPLAEMKGINQKRKNICLILFTDGPFEDVEISPGSILAVAVTKLYGWMHFKICLPGYMLIYLLTLSSRQEHSSECQRKPGAEHVSSLPIHNVAKENSRPNTCTQRSLRDSMGTLLPIWPLWEMRDVIGSWWIGIWYPKCI